MQDEARRGAVVPINIGSSSAQTRTATLERRRRLDDKKFSFLADLLPQMVWTATPDGSIDYINQRWFDYTGQMPEQAMGRGWEGVIHPDDMANTLRNWAEANRTGMPGSVEHRFKDRNGQYRLHVTRYMPQRDSAGTIVRWFGTSTDVHDERQREARVADTQKRAALSDLAHGLAHDINNPLAALTNLIYIAKAKANLPDARDLIEEAERQAQRITALVHSILVLGEATGHGSKYSEQLDSERLRRRRKEYEAALHVASIVNSAHDAIYSKTMDGAIVAWNPAAERLFGYTAQEIVGQNVSVLMPAQLKHELPEVIERLHRGERIERYETARITKDGRRVRVSVSISPVLDPAGEFVGASAIAREL